MIKKELKRILKKLLLSFYLEKKADHVNVSSLFHYILFQKVIGINRSVPWPVHWSSIVSFPERISRKHWRPFPGFLPGSYIQAKNGIEIGRNVRLGPGIKIISASHSLSDYDIHDDSSPIVIGDNCWIAANAIILPGVRLGDHTVVAAGAVVNKSFETGNCVIGGVPAKKIKDIEKYTGNTSW